MRSAKLLVPAGVLTHDSCGETFSPTQFGLLPGFLLAAFTGSMPPSLKVVDEISKTFACAKAEVADSENARAAPPAKKSCPNERYIAFLPSAFLPWHDFSV